MLLLDVVAYGVLIVVAVICVNKILSIDTHYYLLLTKEKSKEIKETRSEE